MYFQMFQTVPIRFNKTYHSGFGKALPLKKYLVAYLSKNTSSAARARDFHLHSESKSAQPHGCNHIILHWSKYNLSSQAPSVNLQLHFIHSAPKWSSLAKHLETGCCFQLWAGMSNKIWKQSASKADAVQTASQVGPLHCVQAQLPHLTQGMSSPK